LTDPRIGNVREPENGSKSGLLEPPGYEYPGTISWLYVSADTPKVIDLKALPPKQAGTP